jgi:hypothetical protein
MILHAWWLTRRTRPEHLVDLVEPDPARRPRIFALTAAALVLLTLGWFRLDAWWIVHDSEAAHAHGDCVSATTALESLDAVHRVAYGPITLRADEEREACDILVEALDQTPHDAAATIEAYMAHPGAVWDGAGVQRAEYLLAIALSGEDPNLATVERAFEQLTATLDEHPDQSETVRNTVEALLADLVQAPPCTGYEIDFWLAEQTWDRPEITEPIAAAADRVPVRMLRCAQDRTDEDVQGAGILYREFLTAYPDHPLAGEAANGILDSGSYCTDPVAYQGAPAFDGPGPHPMQLVGSWDAEGRGFPDSWLATSAKETELVVCVDAEVGEFQDSCQYSGSRGTFWGVFYAHKFTIKAYSLKTGELVTEYDREIGEACPSRLDGTYSTIYLYSSDDMLMLASEYTDEDFRGMFADLMK